jgi:hypothetical protein
MNVIKDIVMPIVKVVNKANAEKIEYEVRNCYEVCDKDGNITANFKENAIKIWIYADIDEDIRRQLSDLQYSLIRKYGIGIEIVIVPVFSTNLNNS